MSRRGADGAQAVVDDDTCTYRFLRLSQPWQTEVGACSKAPGVETEQQTALQPMIGGYSPIRWVLFALKKSVSGTLHQTFPSPPA